MGRHFKKQEGFTLVEMIVVIAIIAILAAVIIPTTAGFIDRARLSNDRQNATRMTQVLTVYNIENENVDWSLMTGHDIRTILDTFADEPFDFETASSGTGYFFIEATQSIVAEKYGSIQNILLQHEQGFTLSRFFQPATLRANQVASTDRPEQLFGVGSVLLTLRGDKVADTVFALQNIMPYSGRIEADFEALEQFIDDGILPGSGPLEGFFTRIFSDSSYDGLLEDLLEAYHPSSTLYVSEVAWQTVATNGVDVNRILFASGISNIPTYTGTLTDIAITEVRLPASVRSIQADAFKALNNLETVRRPVSTTINIFDETLTIQGGQKVTLDSLQDYSAFVTFRKVEDVVTYDISGLPNREDVTGYRIRTQGQNYRIEIFTREGLIGFAENQTFTVTYKASLAPDRDVFTYRVQTIFFGELTTEDLPVGPEGDGSWQFNDLDIPETLEISEDIVIEWVWNES